MIRSRDLDNRRFVFTPIQSIALLCHYFLGYMFLYPLLITKIDDLIFKTDNGVHPKLYTAFIIFMILSSIAIVYEPLKRSWKMFQLNLPINLINSAKHYGYLFLANFAISIILLTVFKISDPSVNQEIITEMIHMAKIPMFLSTVIFAPIVEEIVFRGVLYQNLRSQKRFYLPMILSILVFGSLHLVAGLNSGKGLFEFVYLFQYGAMAYFMISAMESSNTIVGAITVHFFNNLMAFISILTLATIIL